MMEWRGNGASVFLDAEPRGDPASTSKGYGGAHLHQQSSSSPYDSAMASLCQSQQRCVKASIVSSWRLAETQDQLCSLGVHGSESLEQERARILACPTELVHTEQEWRRKESMLGGHDTSRSPELGAAGSWDVFDKSIINVPNSPQEKDQERGKTFLQMYEQQLRHFGMLRRWDDSQQFLSDQPQLICEETANYLILWCFRLQQEGKEALMEQVAHQAVAMQFILEMASNAQLDPRGCFREFFHKAKAGKEGYLDIFHAELEAFKCRVKEHTVKSPADTPKDSEHQSAGTRCQLEPKEVLESLHPVAESHMKRCLEAGLWTKDDTTDTDDIRMMETS
ncbi:hsp90 co-chaperone Cdc37-like 1 isoform X2 [Lampris incognitus]|uniref:hsp90 co-chaperone Cdc37-like 1 isoform X2 n=1 Tax=Lampris incognitus TaxID=2546036 RepID=UPI0024B5B237|nr:hsp90 co-chaperone Cdc37-like 1 isoform X2 [Lampris incognitus]